MSKTRSALGKGLSALIPGAANDEETVGGIELAAYPSPQPSVAAKANDMEGPYLAMVEIARVAPNPVQPRKDFTSEGLAELTESIKAHQGPQSTQRIP